MPASLGFLCVWGVLSNCFTRTPVLTAHLSKHIHPKKSAMKNSPHQYHQFLFSRFCSLLPKDSRQSLEVGSKPFKWGWNPTVHLCLFVKGSRVRYFVVGYDPRIAIVYAIRVSWDGSIDRGSFNVYSLLQQRNLVKMDGFKVQSWLRTRRREVRAFPKKNFGNSSAPHSICVNLFRGVAPKNPIEEFF